MISLVILAAGRASRFGSSKLLVKLAGRPLIHYTLENAQGSGVDEVLVVLGHRAEKIAKLIHSDKRIVVNPDHGRGLSTSIRAGMEAVDKTAEAAIFLLADQPFVQAWIIDSLVKEFRKRGSHIVAVRHRGEPRNPVLFARHMFPALLSLKGDRGARDVVDKHRKKASFVDVKESRFLFDVDRLSDLNRAEKISKQLASPKS